MKFGEPTETATKAVSIGVNAMKKTNTLQLKSCPFCGGEAYYRVPIVKGCENIMMVECRQCGASPYAVFVSEVLDKDDKKAAIAEKWNRRTQV